MRVLVTAASRHEATMGIAQAIADGLGRRGIAADMVPIEQVDGLSRYDSVVLGSAVYMGRWLPPALAFAHENSTTLASKRVWLFSSGPVGRAARGAEQSEPAAIPELMWLTGARDHRVFAGRLERGQLRFSERAVFTLVGAGYGDERDWNAIDAFAGEVAAELARHSTATATAG
jgi:menaquinone-dependent protoporphyrinogen oxidase